MSKRIGESLVEQGLITPVQLDKALKTQLIHGGHLGTCLIELDFIDEESFGQALAELHGLRYAPLERLRGIPDNVIQALSARWVEKCRAVPIELEDKTLHLAVADPRNLGRLSTLTGYKIVPWIAPEVRVYEAMDVYYGIPRSARYIRACEELERHKRNRRSRREHAGDEAAVPDPSSDVLLGEASSVSASRTRTPQDIGAEYGYGKSWREVADELFAEEHAATKEAATRSATAVEVEQTARARPRGNLYQRMSRAEDKDQLGRIVLDHAAEKMTGAILFFVKSETATIWDWTGLDLNPGKTRSMRFPVVAGSIFTLMLGDGYYRGPVPEQHDCRWFYGALQLPVPEEVLLLPVYLNDRLVAIFYGDGGPAGEIRGTTESYLRLAQKLGMALNMLLLKMKISSEG